jgi:nucleotide-binding universal stress UspA family protein
MPVLMVLDAAGDSHALLEYVRTIREGEGEYVLLSVSLSGREADLEAARNVLNEALHTLGEEPTAVLRTRLEIGYPAEVIARVANEEAADVIMMPAYGDGEFPRLKDLGDVAHEVAHRTNIPILIKSPVGFEALMRDERILTVPLRS